jgi:hypothetical protein
MICIFCGGNNVYWENIGGIAKSIGTPPFSYCPDCGKSHCRKEEEEEENGNEKD